jgi:flavin reductase (DIM6/NTAB) family NADH-FMN oxidoreductase RutF
MELDGTTFRAVMGDFLTGVTVVTSLAGDEPQGITVSALAPVSLDPPLIMVALDRGRFMTPTVAASKRFVVNVLAEDQQLLSDCFAHAPVKPGREEFCGAGWRPAPKTGAPILDGVMAWVECSVVEAYSVGDHELFIGRVESLDHASDGPLPLLYFRRRYLRIERAADSAVEGKPEA